MIFNVKDTTEREDGTELGDAGWHGMKLEGYGSDWKGKVDIKRNEIRLGRTTRDRTRLDGIRRGEAKQNETRRGATE